MSNLTWICMFQCTWICRSEQHQVQEQGDFTKPELKFEAYLSFLRHVTKEVLESSVITTTCIEEYYDCTYWEVSISILVVAGVHAFSPNLLIKSSTFKNQNKLLD